MTTKSLHLKVPNLGEEFELQVGYLDPFSEDSGQTGRLRNLAYLTSADDPDPTALDSAIQEFQCNAKISVDGKIGPQTQDKLNTVHGC